MLKKQFRLNLRKQPDFFSNCKKVHTPYFSFFYTPSQSFQIAVIVAKKVCLLATQRNAVKRNYLQAVEILLDDLTELNSNVILVVHDKGSHLSVAEIAQHIKANVQKIRI